MIHPYLSRLNISQKVQEFFDGSFHSDKIGNLVFPYPDGIEHFGFSFHRVPASNGFWMSGNDYSLVKRQVFISHSAMEAIAFLSLNHYRFRKLDELFFLATGSGINQAHLNWINRNLPGRQFSLLFGNDVLGKIADLKVAAGIRGIHPAIFLTERGGINIFFRLKNYQFLQEQFSLYAIEKASGYRFEIPAFKPRSYSSFLEQIRKRL